MLGCTFTFFDSFTYISTKSIIEQLHNAEKSFFGVIIVNALNKDEGLTHIKWLEKVQHIESAQRYTRAVRHIDVQAVMHQWGKWGGCITHIPG